METMRGWKRRIFILFSVVFLLGGDFIDAELGRRRTQESPSSSSPVNVHKWPGHVRLSNGVIKLTLSVPTGHIAAIEHNGINVLLKRVHENSRGYWDIVWDRPDVGTSHFDKLDGMNFEIVASGDEAVEVSFTKTWNVSLGADIVPLNIDKRFIVLRGVSGFYSYAIFEHLEGWPAVNVGEARIAFKLEQSMFKYMAVSDSLQRIMPTQMDLNKGKPLAYREATLLSNPGNAELKGEVDDKYMYSVDNRDSHVHGWISSKSGTGFWVITPSDEFRAGGPVKPELTSHAPGTSLAAFFSSHYAGPDFGVKLKDGEAWKKVFGPVFVYLNSDDSARGGKAALWEDAKRQMNEETRKWPYDFPSSPDFPRRHERSSVAGRFLISDWFVHSDRFPAKGANVGLASPGEVGSWQSECKGYQFWAVTDEQGNFTITGIRPGTYSLHAWVPGFPGDYKYQHDIVIDSGKQVILGDLIYAPPRNGPTLWEIGYPDRSAAEFFVPDPDPALANKLFLNKTEHKYRQYGLWDRYTDYYASRDLIYTVGVSDYAKDWWYAHLNRRIDHGNGTAEYAAATWTVEFDLNDVDAAGLYILRIALASTNSANLQVWVNNPNAAEVSPFMTGRTGRGNAIARHGIHGQYLFYSMEIGGSQLRKGRNAIYFKQAIVLNPFSGILYDYIRLEGPPAKP